VAWDRPTSGPTVPTVPRVMTEAIVSFAGNLTDQPEVRYTEAGRS
jgi:hypothetical protein